MSRNDFSLFTVSFAAALAVFFGFAQEPWENIGLLLIFMAILAHMLAHMGARPQVQKLAHIALVFAVGFAWAQFVTLAQHRGTGAPVFERGDRLISGEIIWGELRARGSLIDMTVYAPDGPNYGVRLYGKRDLMSRLRPGCHAQLIAALSPLQKPVVIGGYDPRFTAWFDGRRGQGFVRSVEAIDCSARLSLKHRISRLRLRLAAHYRAVMSPQTGPVAAALITGCARCHRGTGARGISP